MYSSYPNNGAASTPAHTYTFTQKWGDDPFTERAVRPLHSFMGI